MVFTHACTVIDKCNAVQWPLRAAQHQPWGSMLVRWALRLLSPMLAEKIMSHDIWLCPVNGVGLVDQIPTTYVGGQIGLPSDRRWPPPAGQSPRAGLGPMGAWAPWAPIQFVLPITSSFLLNRPQPYDRCVIRKQLYTEPEPHAQKNDGRTCSAMSLDCKTICQSVPLPLKYLCQWMSLHSELWSAALLSVSVQENMSSHIQRIWTGFTSTWLNQDMGSLRKSRCSKHFLYNSNGKQRRKTSRPMGKSKELNSFQWFS